MAGASPYGGSNFGPAKFWRSGVAEADPTALVDVYRKRFDIALDAPIATAGSCFAQHIATRMSGRGFNVLDVEPPPPGLSLEQARRFRYRTFSARYGNIYSVRQLLQLAQEALGLFTPGEMVWEKGGRYFDALRPTAEPEGLDSPEEVLAHRAQHLRSVRTLLETSRIFVFTFGLTECWHHRASGTVFPVAPGVTAGRYDPDIHAFHNMSFGEVVTDFMAFRSLTRALNPDIKFIITVSPVPLTATASDQHVLVATSHSKAILRAAAAEIFTQCADVDYFPSYEIITNVASRSAFYEDNFREIRSVGVESAMRAFFAQHTAARADQGAATSESDDIDPACEDAFLDLIKSGAPR